MSGISVVIISYNEERNIARCVKSVLGIADEIIVVDSYSTDKTEEICRGLGVDFYQHLFEGFRQQKNYALSLASNDYVLSLDADEALSEGLYNRILEIKGDTFSTIAARKADRSKKYWSSNPVIGNEGRPFPSKERHLSDAS